MVEKWGVEKMKSCKEELEGGEVEIWVVVKKKS